MKIKKFCACIFISVMAISLTACGTPKSDAAKAVSGQSVSDIVFLGFPKMEQFFSVYNVYEVTFLRKKRTVYTEEEKICVSRCV